MLLLVAIMLLILLLARSDIGAAVSMVIWGAATFAVVPPLQMRVMRVASEAPGLSSSVNIGAFNLGNALGAAAGGAVVSAGLGYSFVPVMGRLSPGWRCCWCCSPAAPPQSRLRQRLSDSVRRFLSAARR